MKRLYKDILILGIILIAMAVYGHYSQTKFSVKLEEITAIKITLGIASIIAFIILVRLHFLPYFIARDRKHRNKIPILLTNIFFGWSFLGWCVALIWANTCNVETENMLLQQPITPLPETKTGQFTDKWNRAA